VASYADVQYALHQAPVQGAIPVEWQRAGQAQTGQVEVAAGWRKTDISWRASMWALRPSPFVYGRDLTAAEKQALGLPEKQLAFRQGKFVPAPSKALGIQHDDIIIGIDGKVLDMTMLEFNAYIRINFKVGDRITLNVIRNGQRLDFPMTLPNQPSL
jgi:hypothetical protein